MHTSVVFDRVVWKTKLCTRDCHLVRITVMFPKDLLETDTRNSLCIFLKIEISTWFHKDINGMPTKKIYYVIWHIYIYHIIY